MGLQVLGSAEDGGDGISYMRYNKEELETTVDSTFHDITSTEQKGKWLRTWCAAFHCLILNVNPMYLCAHLAIRQLHCRNESTNAVATIVQRHTLAKLYHVQNAGSTWGPLMSWQSTFLSMLCQLSAESAFVNTISHEWH
jgi:hypothetical protein